MVAVADHDRCRTDVSGKFDSAFNRQTGRDLTKVETGIQDGERASGPHGLDWCSEFHKAIVDHLNVLHQSHHAVAVMADCVRLGQFF